MKIKSEEQKVEGESFSSFTSKNRLQFPWIATLRAHAITTTTTDRAGDDTHQNIVGMIIYIDSEAQEYNFLSKMTDFLVKVTSVSPKFTVGVAYRHD